MPTCAKISVTHPSLNHQVSVKIQVAKEWVIEFKCSQQLRDHNFLQELNVELELELMLK
jgi:hypothetical protein